ncbi:hypothetical protein A1O3_02391 [Capronia epimyces CBS 606.96]|uniref:Uncharacterized protein n=1 Tax=Capronia epimyces CBS 606.96 TaxID=1182542 RepID=W9Z490_9EURO|nr:uncharacterized protein A1O3_02391 [Capronia epimyces CBS 606.96]EXJ89324.1 hypothetical protein A1O3_02391 [Capronia epimyces CBS 606.96]
MSQNNGNGDEKYFNVYKVQSHLAVQDPDMPQPRYHTVVSTSTTSYSERDKDGIPSLAPVHGMGLRVLLFATHRSFLYYPTVTSNLLCYQIFVETSDNKSGFIHHVVGDLVTGMTYQREQAAQPEQSSTFHSKQHLGRVKESVYSQFHQVCAQQPPPGQQKKFNRETMRTEPIKPNGDFYLPGEPRARLIKCTEWVLERAIPALQAARILM